MEPIIKPDLYFGMSDETYHADPVVGGSLSSTFARLLTEHVPAKAKARRDGRRPTKSMNLGKAVHSIVLGAGPVLITWEHDGRTKAGKEERAALAPQIASEAVVAVTEVEREQIVGMVDALMAHDDIARIIEEARTEVSGFWIENGVWCRSRIDILGDDLAWDYKTTQDPSRAGFSKALGAYGYHQQADFYQRGLKALGHKAGRNPMRFICQEIEAPYLVQIHVPDAEAMWAAAELNDRAIRVYSEAVSTGIWPGYAELFAEPTPLPAWYIANHEEALGLEVVI